MGALIIRPIVTKENTMHLRTQVNLLKFAIVSVLALMIFTAAASSGGGLPRHLSDLGNPHATTKAQVGLSDVANYAVASQAEAEAGEANDKFMTPLRTAQEIAALASTTTPLSTPGMVLIASLDIPNGNLDFMDLDLSAYKVVKLFFTIEGYTPVGGSVKLRFNRRSGNFYEYRLSITTGLVTQV